MTGKCGPQKTSYTSHHRSKLTKQKKKQNVISINLFMFTIKNDCDHILTTNYSLIKLFIAMQIGRFNFHNSNIYSLFCLEMKKETKRKKTKTI